MRVHPPGPDCLCREARQPETLGDPLDLHCGLETGRYAPSPVGDPTELLVVAYNLERGMAFSRQLQLLRTHPVLARADLLLLSEADRGCSRTGARNVARELAEALSLDYAFGVEYVELPRQARQAVNQVTATCEHGNAILSRWPLEEVHELRHARTVSWYGHPREPRLGGAMSLRARVRVGERTLGVTCTHFDSGLARDAERRSQAEDLVRAAHHESQPQVLGGDLNTFRYAADLWLGTRLDPTPPVFARAGFADAHAALPPWKRGTTDRSYGLRGVIDLVFVRGLRVLESGVVSPRHAGGLSDHLPVWTRLRWS